MAKLRRDVFTESKPKRDRGRGSFYGVHLHTGLTAERLFHSKPPFTAALDDVYGTHVTWGDSCNNQT